MDIISKNRNIFFAEGILFVILGTLAIILPGMSTLGVELLIGWLFLFGGIIQGVRAFKAYEQRGFWPSLLGSVVSIIVGVLLLLYPLTGILTLTLLLIVFFLLEGIAKIAFSLQMRPAARWGWLFFSGVLALLMAAIIWSGWPLTAAWVIGLLVGINMLFFGFSLITLAWSSHDKTEV